MKILIVAATAFEIRPMTERLTLTGHPSEFLTSYMYQNMQVDVLIPGVGIMLTAWHLGMLLPGATYDFAINAGIAGAFERSLPLGKVVNITEESLTEFGAQDGENFLSIFDLGLMDPDQFPYQNGRLINPLAVDSKTLKALPRVSGSTVDTIHERRTLSQRSGTMAGNRYDVESMEGAAFLHGCLFMKLPCAQIRSISNYVEERDKSRWNVKLALENLNKTLMLTLQDLAAHEGNKTKIH